MTSKESFEEWITGRVQDVRNTRRRIRYLYDRLQRELTARSDLAEPIKDATERLDRATELIESPPRLEPPRLEPLLEWFGAQATFLAHARAYLNLITRADFIEGLRRVLSALTVNETLTMRDRLLEQLTGMHRSIRTGYALVPNTVVEQLGKLEQVGAGMDLGLLVALSQRASKEVRGRLEQRLEETRDRVLGAPPAEQLQTMRAGELLSLAPASSEDVGSTRNLARLVLPDRDRAVRLYRIGALTHPSRPIRYAMALTEGIVDQLGSPLRIVGGQKLRIEASAGFAATAYTDGKDRGETTRVLEPAPTSLRAAAYGEHLFTGIETRMHLPPNPAWGDPRSEQWEFPRAPPPRRDPENPRRALLPDLRALVRLDPPLGTDKKDLEKLVRREAAAASLLVLGSSREIERTPRIVILNSLASNNK